MNLNIRFPRNMWREYLIEMDNYSEFCRDAIIEKINQEHSEDYIDQQVIVLDNKIKELKDRKKEIKKSKSIDQDQIHELLTYHAPAFKQNAMVRSETQRIRFIEKAITPNIKKLGYKGSPQEIDELLLNWPEAD